MDTIICPSCGKQVTITLAIKHQVEEQIKKDLQEQHLKDIQKIKSEVEEKAFEKARESLEFKFKDAQNELEETKKRNNDLQNQLLEMSKSIRELKDQGDKRELENQKKLNEEIDRMRESVSKTEQEKSKLKELELQKQLDDMKKALVEAQRKGEQKSQQLQGEVLELELEQMLDKEFPHDEIIPVEKGVLGADIQHIVKSPRGFECGMILWEFKRTKDWSDKWIAKLKEDLRARKANIPVIVSIALPKEAQNGFGIIDGVFVCSHTLAIPIAILLRKNLLDVGYQKAITANKGSKAEHLYSYVTSHEFQQQVETIVETYRQMQEQITKERVAFEKSWKQREAQAQKIVLSTANIIGSMQGKVGASMPQIKGLEIDNDSLEFSQKPLIEDAV